MAKRRSIHNSEDRIKNKFNQFTPPPPAGMWDRIADELPVELPFYKKPSFLATVAFIALFFVSSLSYFFYNYQVITDVQIVERNATANSFEKQAQLKNAYSFAAANNTLQATNKSNQKPIDSKGNQKSNAIKAIAQTAKINSPKFKSPKDSKNKIAQKHSLPISKTAVAQNQQTISSNTKGTVQNITQNQQNVSSNKKVAIQTAMLDEKVTEAKKTILKTPTLAQAIHLPNKQISLSTTTNTEVTRIDEIPVISPSSSDRILQQLKGLHFGLTYSINNTWLLNKGVAETQETHYQLHFGRAYGFKLGYDFTPRWGLQLEWILDSSQGQQFGTNSVHASNTTRRFLSKDIHLHYTHLPVLLKYRKAKMSKRTKQPIVANLLLGLQYSRLKSIDINIDSEIIQAEDLLRKADWGLVAGFDVDAHLNKNFSLSVGVRSSLAAGGNNPIKMFTTLNQQSRNFLIGVQTSLKYHFVK